MEEKIIRENKVIISRLQYLNSENEYPRRKSTGEYDIIKTRIKKNVLRNSSSKLSIINTNNIN